MGLIDCWRASERHKTGVGSIGVHNRSVQSAIQNHAKHKIARSHPIKEDSRELAQQLRTASMARNDKEVLREQTLHP